eukprot:COSAG06_NODE_40531_length_401_cov_0.688742_1_plen_114_part_10
MNKTKTCPHCGQANKGRYHIEGCRIIGAGGAMARKLQPEMEPEPEPEPGRPAQHCTICESTGNKPHSYCAACSAENAAEAWVCTSCKRAHAKVFPSHVLSAGAPFWQALNQDAN